MSDTKLIIKGIETNTGVFIQKNSDYNSPDINILFFDGEKAETTNFPKWYKINQIPTKIEKLVKGKPVNYRYRIIDESLINDKIKYEFIQEEVADYKDYEWIWKDEFSNLKRLYNLIWDISKDTLEECEFEYIKLLQIDNLPDLTKFQYSAQLGQWRHESMGFITEKNIIQQDLDRIIFPEPLLPLRPCKLSSQQSYQLVREYIKTNIDPEYAEITSDYNFCFTVKKKIHLDTPETYQVDINNGLFSKRQRKSKWVTKYRSHRMVEVFEMTYSPENYKGYTPIKGFEGTSHEDLLKNIQDYLSKVIEEINKPLVDCPHCKGLGVVEFNKIKTND